MEYLVLIILLLIAVLTNTTLNNVELFVFSKHTNQSKYQNNKTKRSK